MENKIFENSIENRMEGFQMKPSEAVWQAVEKRIQKEKKRRALIWWWIMAMAITGAGIQFLQDAERNNQNISAAKTTNEAGNSSVDVKDETSNSLPTSEDPIENPSNNISSSKDVLKNHSYLKDQHYTIKVNNNKEINSNNLASDEAQQNFNLETTKGFINKENIEQHPIAVKKIGNDTIVILRCEDIGKTKLPSTQITPLDRQLNFNAYYSFHGTGDLSGTNLEFGTEKRWGKRYGFYNNLGLTIHSGQELSLTYPLRLNSTYKKMQTVTAGIQTTPTIYRYSKRGDIKIGAGLVARYQVSSSGDYGASSMGTGTNQYSFRIYNTEPNSFSIGYCISAELLLFERKKNQWGFQAFFQNDTKGDVITGLGLTFQTKYKK